MSCEYSVQAASKFWDQYRQGEIRKLLGPNPPLPCVKDFYYLHLQPQSSSKVLDLGCGRGCGCDAVWLAQEGCKIYGIDISGRAIAYCQKLFKDWSLAGHFVQGALENIPFTAIKFRAAICLETIDHVPLEKAKTSLSVVRSLLQPDGKILLTFDPVNTDQNEFEAGNVRVLPDGTWFYTQGKYKGMFFRRYTDSEIKRLVGEDKVISFEYSDDGNRYLVCR
jgi:2-polyprenyl-3-methyl-5-hydroxy-6-metoxy-1,4-benzoquinol methylase